LGFVKRLIWPDNEDALSIGLGGSNIWQVINAVAECGNRKAHSLVEQRVGWRRNIIDSTCEIRSAGTCDLVARLAGIGGGDQLEGASYDFWWIGIH
jgi:hypothetical protein